MVFHSKLSCGAHGLKLCEYSIQVFQESCLFWKMDNIGPFVRQMLVAVSPQLAALSMGGAVVFPTVLQQQLKAKDSPIPIDMDTSSWIGSIYGFSGIPVIFLPMLMQWRGRKIAYILTCLFVFTGWILSCTAVNIEMILISEAFHGLGTNSLLPVSCLSMTEMLAPKYRFISMHIIGIVIGLGMTIVGILGRFLHYKTISYIMVGPVVVAILVAFIWPESPPWLACKGKLEECKETFVWLRGTDKESNKELQELISSQRNNRMNLKNKEAWSFSGFWSQISRRDFYLPSLHIYLLLNMLYWSGGDVIVIYFIDIVERSTSNEDASFYASIVMYVIIFIGTLITHVLIRNFKNKTVLLSSTSGVIVCLFSIAIITFLQKHGILEKDSLLCTIFLVAFIIFNSVGLNSVVFFMGAELMPVKHRAAGGALYIVCNCGLYACSLKLSPYLLLHAGMCGTFLLYALNAAACALLVHRCVPETKGRTLTELEHYYNYGKFVPRSTDTSEREPINSV